MNMEIKMKGCLVPALAVAQIVMLVLKLTGTAEYSWAVALIPVMIIGVIYLFSVILVLVFLWMGQGTDAVHLTINVSYDNFGERSLRIDSPVPAEKGIVKDIVRLLNSYLEHD